MICQLIFLLISVVLFSAVTGENCPPVAVYSGKRNGDCDVKRKVGFSGNRNPAGNRRKAGFFGNIKVVAGANAGSCECGISQDKNGGRQRIIGGTEVQPPYKYPWMVAVYRGKQHTCGAALITQTFVLTAAHCFLNDKVRSPVDNSQSICLTSEGKTVRCFADGSSFKAGVIGKGKTVNKFYKVKRYIKHPKFDLTAMMYDFALIELQQPIECSSYTRPICLPDKVEAPRAGTEVVLSGWGRTHQDPTGNLPQTSKKLLEAKLKIQPRSKCEEKSNPGHKTHVCALGEGQGACVGDSGGPLFHEVKGKYYIFGVTSFGKDKVCNPNDAQFYSNVLKALGWIHKTTGT